MINKKQKSITTNGVVVAKGNFGKVAFGKVAFDKNVDSTLNFLHGFYYISCVTDKNLFYYLKNEKRFSINRYEVREVENKMHMALSFNKQNEKSLTLNAIFKEFGFAEEEYKIIKGITYKQVLMICQNVPAWESGHVLFKGKPLTNLEKEQKKCITALEEVGEDYRRLFIDEKYKALVEKNVVFINSYLQIKEKLLKLFT